MKMGGELIVPYPLYNGINDLPVGKIHSFIFFGELADNDFFRDIFLGVLSRLFRASLQEELGCGIIQFHILRQWDVAHRAASLTHLRRSRSELVAACTVEICFILLGMTANTGVIGVSFVHGKLKVNPLARLRPC